LTYGFFPTVTLALEVVTAQESDCSLYEHGNTFPSPILLLTAEEQQQQQQPYLDLAVRIVLAVVLPSFVLRKVNLNYLMKVVVASPSLFHPQSVMKSF
jgi:hypothetical protein